MRLGLLCALPAELDPIARHLERATEVECARRNYLIGRLWEREAALVVSRPGKVAAATAATALIERFAATELVVIGFAGALAPTLRRGDLLLPSDLWQHDMRPSRRFERFEIPFLGVKSFPTSAERRDACRRAFAQMTAAAVTLHEGGLASGDQFIADAAAREQLRCDLPHALAVDMESAAAAQVAFEYGMAITVIKVISDGCGPTALADLLAAERGDSIRLAVPELLRRCLA
jgi:adenosylhomocysteine nucleosidase